MSFTQNQRDVKCYSSYYNEGLRSYMLKVYNYMAAALGITGLVAYLVASSPTLLSAIYNSPLQWLIMFAPIVFVFVFSAKLHTMRLETAQLSFWLFASLMGLSLSWVFIAYTGTSIARVFFIASSMFGTMAIYGNTTKRDLTAMGSFLIMGVFGLIIASLVNLFAQSAALHFATSLLGVILFTGLTAYDAQKIKDVYYRYNDGNDLTLGRFAIMGALTLYFDFINIFISLLHLMGDRR
ncbi:MAG: Bax inhibitor-1/YccA family protein [Rickettsiaceae bacterium H1]|nr:Bax inhibitor-1/YccA family protein [Rickettsiaceae bacterium H1]